jgi:hypothetical protein
LFRAMGGFDEMLTAAEDYDLWLRLLRDYPVGLVDKPLVTRRAGHPGQLSVDVPALDRFRILALLKLLADTGIMGERRRAVCEVLAEKCRIYGQGLARRGQDQSAAAVRQIGDHADAWRDSPDTRVAWTLEAYRATVGQPFSTRKDLSLPEGAAL